MMKYRHIVSVTGLSGLYQLLSTKNNGAFVKNLDDLSNKFISSRTHNVTPLESIEIYTVGDNIYLHEVFEKLKAVDEKIQSLSLKDNAAVAALFGEAVPEYDVERVYLSDIKKIFRWYLLLKKNELLDFSDYFNTTEGEGEVDNADNTIEEEEAPKPAKKAKKAKAAVKSEAEESTTEEKPKAKRTSKKKTEDDDATEEAPKPAKRAKKKKTEE